MHWKITAIYWNSEAKNQYLAIFTPKKVNRYFQKKWQHQATLWPLVWNKATKVTVWNMHKIIRYSKLLFQKTEKSFFYLFHKNRSQKENTEMKITEIRDKRIESISRHHQRKKENSFAKNFRQKSVHNETVIFHCSMYHCCFCYCTWAKIFTVRYNWKKKQRKKKVTVKQFSGAFSFHSTFYFWKQTFLVTLSVRSFSRSNRTTLRLI